MSNYYHSPRPTRSPYGTNSPSPSPTQSPIPSNIPTPTPSQHNEPTSTPRQSESPAPTPRTDLSDNRSDGKTGSLGCLRPEDNCNTQVGIIPKANSVLPTTGDNTAYLVLAVCLVMFLVGTLLRR